MRGAAAAALGIFLLAGPASARERVWLSASSPRLEVRFSEERHRLLAADLLSKGEEFLEDTSRFLGIDAGGPYTLALADSEEEFRRLQPGRRAAPEWAGALTYPSLRLVLIQTPAAMKTEGDRYWALLHHEMVHLVMGDAEIREDVSFPLWFSEGVATYLAGEMNLSRLLSLSWAQISGRAPSFRELEDAFPDDPELAEAAYGQSYLFVRYLTRRFGPDAVARLFSAAVEAGDLDTAFPRAFGLSRGELLEGFGRYARLRATWIPVATSTAGLWGALALLLLYGYWFKRHRNRGTLEAWDMEEVAAALAEEKDEEREDPPPTLH